MNGSAVWKQQAADSNPAMGLNLSIYRYSLTHSFFNQKTIIFSTKFSAFWSLGSILSEKFPVAIAFEVKWFSANFFQKCVKNHFSKEPVWSWKFVNLLKSVIVGVKNYFFLNFCLSVFPIPPFLLGQNNLTSKKLVVEHIVLWSSDWRKPESAFSFEIPLCCYYFFSKIPKLFFFHLYLNPNACTCYAYFFNMVVHCFLTG